MTTVSSRSAADTSATGSRTLDKLLNTIFPLDKDGKRRFLFFGQSETAPAPDDPIRAFVFQSEGSGRQKRLGFYNREDTKHGRWAWFALQPDGTWDFDGFVHVTELAKIDSIQRLASFTMIAVPYRCSLVESWTLRNGGGNGVDAAQR